MDWSKAYVADDRSLTNSGSSELGNNPGEARSDTDPEIVFVTKGVMSSPEYVLSSSLPLLQIQ